MTRSSLPLKGSALGANPHHPSSLAFVDKGHSSNGSLKDSILPVNLAIGAVTYRNCLQADEEGMEGE